MGTGARESSLYAHADPLSPALACQVAGEATVQTDPLPAGRFIDLESPFRFRHLGGHAEQVAVDSDDLDDYGHL